MAAKAPPALAALRAILDRPRHAGEGELLRRFLATRDHDVFATLVERHGPMVLGLCRRVVGDYHVAEDVFQATFLMLARKARSIRRPESLAAWLHGTALRLAVRARRGLRRAPVVRTPRPVPTPPDELKVREVLAIVDEELQALPGDGTFCWDIPGRRLLWRNKEFAAGTLTFTHDGKVLRPHTLLPALDLVTGKAAPAEKLPPLEPGDRLSSTRDGKVLFVARAAGVLVWDLVKGSEVRMLSGANGDLLPPPDGQSLVTNNGVLQRWDVASGKATYADTFAQGHVDEVTHVVFSADGRRLASAARDGTVRLWDAATAKPLHVWPAHPADQAHKTWYARERTGVRALDFSADGGLLLSAGADGDDAPQEPPPVPNPPPADRLKIWDTQTGSERRTIRLPDPEPGAHGFALLHARLGPDARTVTGLFSAAQFGLDMAHSHLAQWDLNDGRMLRRHTIAPARSIGSALSPDGRTMLTKGVLFDAATGRERLRLEAVQEHRDMPAVPYAFSADGLLIAGDFARLGQEAQLYIGPGGLHVWEAATGKLIAAQLKTQSWFAQVAFHPNGRYVAVNDLDGIQLWDLLAAKVVLRRPLPEEIRCATTHGSHASCLAFSADGRRLATGLPDSTILIWELSLPSERPVPLGAGELERLSVDLGDADAAKGWQAAWKLAAIPDEALPWLRGRLRPSQGMPERDEPHSAKRLWEQRAVAVLERIGSAQARQVVEELARGHAAAPLTQHAQGVLRRMK